MSSTSKILFLYTLDFPYGNIEPYLFNELPILCTYFKKIIIVPSEKREANNVLPENVEVVCAQDIAFHSTKKKLFLKNFFLIAGILAAEFFNCKAKLFFFSRFRLTLSEILYSLVLSEKMKTLIDKETLPAIHYSFWMNDYVLSLSILKQKKQITNYAFRVHGFDLYEERRPYNYIPFRERNYKYSSGIYSVSKLGLNYIKLRFSFSEKANYSYLGTLDHGINPFSDKLFIIVTCSGIIPLKRLDLLAKAIALIQFPVKWYHFGDGNNKNKEELQKITNRFAQNIEVEFKGHVSQKEIFDFYKTNPVSVFINVSETEGLPVSVMEAISFGIPVIGTDVGGTSEIITSQTGWLVKKDITEKELADKINSFKISDLNSVDFRKKVKIFWHENFSAQKNYNQFSGQLLALK
ncbi:MAG: glycosyltransferase [Bacteroidia bacterium]|nr:glycosyltransferase [Bacteroidia bacterium]